mmetsp:Transcript_118647/g.228931  ORF Transcript_118647/g.228931 Transcript_118647/m.228931 type:complete len:396 (+) Transcript_118647:68-1255(+)
MMACRSVLLAMFCSTAMAELRWREALLEQAKTRIFKWYNDPTQMEVSQDRNGVRVNIMKKDRECGGTGVPVTFASFDVDGARPVDVFNAMLDTSAQLQWNKECKSVIPIGEFVEHGARGWSVTFGFPIGGDREFVQWQVASADFEKEEFWIVYSTLNNHLLHEAHPLQAGVVESQNCLGAYRIFKTASGKTHVVITQNVNVHVPLGFPIHLVLDIFPPAWKYTIQFVNELSDQSRLQANLGWDARKTKAPVFMLEDASKIEDASSKRTKSTDLLFPEQRVTEDISGNIIIAVLVAACVCCSISSGVIFVCCCWKRGTKLSRGLNVLPDEDPSLTLTDSDGETASSLFSPFKHEKRDVAFSFETIQSDGRGSALSSSFATDSDGEYDRLPFNCLGR